VRRQLLVERLVVGERRRQRFGERELVGQQLVER
jgi:hypothetical protein